MEEELREKVNGQVTWSTTPHFNNGLPIVDWYQLPESFSSRLIQDAFTRYQIKKNSTLLDPFGGAGTTIVTAILEGRNGIEIEVNPFLAFAARVKCELTLNTKELWDDLNKLMQRVVKSTLAEISESKLPDMPRLEKWISLPVAYKAATLHDLIGEIPDGRRRAFFYLALAAVLRPSSNMKLTPHAFGSRVIKKDAPLFEAFNVKVQKMIQDLEAVQGLDIGISEVWEGDSRNISNLNSKLMPATIAITSPPYVNNLDYTMQTRLELFFLGFIQDMNELRQLRRSMVISDAKAMYRDIQDGALVRDIPSIALISQRLRDKLADKKWGWDYPFMVEQYFGGIYKVLIKVRDMLERGGRFLLVVGDSSHSGVLVAATEIVGELGSLAGYELEKVEVQRIRRSSSHKHELKESIVVLRR